MAALRLLLSPYLLRRRAYLRGLHRRSVDTMDHRASRVREDSTMHRLLQEGSRNMEVHLQDCQLLRPASVLPQVSRWVCRPVCRHLASAHRLGSYHPAFNNSNRAMGGVGSAGEKVGCLHFIRLAKALWRGIISRSLWRLPCTIARPRIDDECALLREVKGSMSVELT